MVNKLRNTMLATGLVGLSLTALAFGYEKKENKYEAVTLDSCVDEKSKLKMELINEISHQFYGIELVSSKTKKIEIYDCIFD
jgi:hypothetical protein